jgi:hypothetical protein
MKMMGQRRQDACVHMKNRSCGGIWQAFSGLAPSIPSIQADARASSLQSPDSALVNWLARTVFKNPVGSDRRGKRFRDDRSG